MLRRIKAIVIKEFFQIIRDPSSILISVFLPTILLFIYAYAVSLDIQHLRVGLVLEDTAPDAQSFAKAMTNSPYFQVKISRDRKEVENEVVRGNLRGFVVIPTYFSAFRQKPSKEAPIQVIADASDPNTAEFLKNYVEAAFTNWLTIEAISSDWKPSSLIHLENRYWFNESLNSRNFLIPGSLAVILTLIGTLLTSLVIAREWERGTMEALMATPMKISEFMIGKMIAYFLLGMLAYIVSTALAVFFFEVPLRGSFWVLTLTSSVFLLTALGLGLLISTLSKNQMVATQAAFVAGFLPAYMLSGFIFDIPSMPKPIQWITYLMPARYFVTALKTIFLAGDIAKLIWINTLVMAVIAIIFYLLIIKKTVKRLE